ncbi:hypothetical protein [Kibdelosporangium aridum]|nr:hypothetical protein [Kibdelosporangium aridum]
MLIRLRLSQWINDIHAVNLPRLHNFAGLRPIAWCTDWTPD